MVVDRRSGTIEHHRFADLPAFLDPRDCLVLNATRVLPARFQASRRSGARISGLFVSESRPGQWIAMVTHAGRLRGGETLLVTAPPDGRTAAPGAAPWSLRFIRRIERGLCELQLDPPDPAATVLARIGAAPLPPYIRRSRESPDDRHRDREAYQTVYAQADGAVAAPTAGLHFTPELLATVRRLGVTVATCVLHVGLGTFQPVEVSSLVDHPMHPEWYDLPAASVKTLQACRQSGGRAIAVGTTSVRVLETCAEGGTLQAGSGWTRLLIHPPFAFQSVDALITNFHLPGSTLLALVYAFAGTDLTRRAYRTAVQQRYRFYSFGDAMLIV